MNFTYEVSCHCGWAYVAEDIEEMFRAQNYHERECSDMGRMW